MTVGPKVVTGIFPGTTTQQQFSNRAVLIDVVHDTCYLCTPLRTKGIKPMSRGFSGCRQVKKLPIEEIVVEFVNYRQKDMKAFSS